MPEYLYWSGVILNAGIVIVLLFLLWTILIWPAIEAISMTRYYLAIARKYPDVKLKNRFRVFVYHFEFFGRTFEATRCSYGEWRGVGNWTVY